MMEKLLFEISQITKKYALIHQKTGGYFNIFDITGISSDEVIICKLLHELLNPIEVKIYAGDQKRQCFDYYKQAHNSRVYYLTLDGRPPSAISAEGLTLNSSVHLDINGSACVDLTENYKIQAHKMFKMLYGYIEDIQKHFI